MESKTMCGSKHRIVWDLDGVLRDLTTAVSIHLGKPFAPTSWNSKIVMDIDLCQYINLYPQILVDAPQDKYLPFFIVNDPHGTILTCQPLHWIPYTKVWLKEHLPMASIVWCQHPEEKLDWCRDHDALIIEDYPFFSSYDSVLLIDHEYNHNTNAKIRIRSLGELEALWTGKGGRYGVHTTVDE